MCLKFLLLLLIVWNCIYISQCAKSPLDKVLEKYGSFCPASYISQNMAQASHDIHSDIYFSYPIDVYGTSSKVDSKIPLTRYTCSSPEGSHLHSKHSCSSDSICPVMRENLEDAVAYNSDIPCARHDDETIVQVLILGGSVTMGGNAGGCCCSSDIDQQCPMRNRECAAQHDAKTAVPACSWAAYFKRLLSQVSTRYKVINLAVSGSTSTRMSVQINDILTTKGITLSSKDIVLIDYSVEPQIIYHQEEVFSSTSGMESLIRQLLAFSRGSWPSIVLLQMHALHFSQLYGALSIRYKLSMWSLKSIVLSSYCTQHQSSIIPYLKFSNNFYGSARERHHPPWHVHLFYADMISSLFLNKFHYNCTIGNPPISSTILPLPISHNEQISCEGSEKIFFIADFREPIYNSSVDIFRERRTSSWPHMEDGPGEYGLVSILDGGEDLETFYLNIPKEVLLLQENVELLFQYTFLRTNLNAGAVQIIMCDRWIGYADSLWKNFRSVKVSVSIKHSLSFAVSDISKYCHGEAVPFISFEHYRHTSKSKEESTARTRGQRFRLERLELCVPIRIKI